MKALVLITMLLLSVGCSNTTTPSSSTTTAPSTPASASASQTPLDGKALYESNCSACHGSDAKGVTGLGKTLVGSAMFKQSDAELVAFVTRGRDPGDKANTTGIAMPPKGGNPALTEPQIDAIVKYLRTIQ